MNNHRYQHATGTNACLVNNCTAPLSAQSNGGTEKNLEQEDRYYGNVIQRRYVFSATQALSTGAYCIRCATRIKYPSLFSLHIVSKERKEAVYS